NHRASDKPPSTARRPFRWRSRLEIGVASSETTVGAPLNTTYWGLLKQPDKQKKSSPLKRKSIMTVSEFRSRFGDEVLCGEHLTAQRWPNGFVCPRCGGRSRGYMASRRVHECAGCGY